jgi:hypothetical protein
MCLNIPGGKIKNPPDLLRRVYDILIFAHIINSSPESKHRNDDDVKFCNPFLKIMDAKIVIKIITITIFG